MFVSSTKLREWLGIDGSLTVHFLSADSCDRAKDSQLICLLDTVTLQNSALSTNVSLTLPGSCCRFLNRHQVQTNSKKPDYSTRNVELATDQVESCRKSSGYSHETRNKLLWLKNKQQTRLIRRQTNRKILRYKRTDARTTRHESSLSFR